MENAESIINFEEKCFTEAVDDAYKIIVERIKKAIYTSVAIGNPVKTEIPTSCPKHIYVKLEEKLVENGFRVSKVGTITENELACEVFGYKKYEAVNFTVSWKAEKERGRTALQS